MTSRLFAFVTVGVLIPLSAALASVTARTLVDFARAPLASRSAFAAMVQASSRNPKTPAIALAGRALRVAVIQWDGSDRSLLVAPTKDGGFCKSLSGAYGGTGCIPDRARLPDSELDPGLVGDASGPIAFNGTFFNAQGIRLQVRYQDGHRSSIPVIWVNAPINAGFFVYKIPASQRRLGHRPVNLSLFSATGSLLVQERLPATGSSVNTSRQFSAPVWLMRAEKQTLNRVFGGAKPIQTLYIVYPRRIAAIFEFSRVVTCGACTSPSNALLPRGRVIRVTYDRQTREITGGYQFCESSGSTPPRALCLRR